MQFNERAKGPQDAKRTFPIPVELDHHIQNKPVKQEFTIAKDADEYSSPAPIATGLTVAAHTARDVCFLQARLPEDAKVTSLAALSLDPRQCSESALLVARQSDRKLIPRLRKALEELGVSVTVAEPEFFEDDRDTLEQWTHDVEGNERLSPGAFLALLLDKDRERKPGQGTRALKRQEDREQALRPPTFNGSPHSLAASLLPVPDLDPAMLPAAFCEWITDIAERGCFPIEFSAVAALSAIGSLIGKRVAIRPKRFDDWLVCSNVWSAVVGHPGLQKTPSVEEALRPLKRLVALEIERHDSACKDFAQSLDVAKAKEAAAKEALNKAAKPTKNGPAASDEELRRLASQIADCGQDAKPPAPKRYMVADATVEKLQDILSQNTNGTLVFRDELVALFKSMEKQGHEADRAFFLEGWNGLTSMTVDRIGRGHVNIEHLCLTVSGTIQPGPLARYLRAASGGEQNDGFMPRFQLLVYPDPPKDFVNIDRRPNAEARERALAVFERISEFNALEHGLELDQYRNVATVGFCEASQQLFDNWRTELELRLRAEDDTPAMLTHLAKYRSLLPALALMFEVVDTVGSGDRLSSVGLASTKRAATWCEFLEHHARRTYESAQGTEDDTAKALGTRLKAGVLPNPFHLRDLYRKGWTGLTSPEDANRAIAFLEDRQWVKVVTVPSGPQGGQPTELVYINPVLAKIAD